jgi:hypothetical protein
MPRFSFSCSNSAFKSWLPFRTIKRITREGKTMKSTLNDPLQAKTLEPLDAFSLGAVAFTTSAIAPSSQLFQDKTASFQVQSSLLLLLIGMFSLETTPFSFRGRSLPFETAKFLFRGRLFSSEGRRFPLQTPTFSFKVRSFSVITGPFSL